MRDFLRSYLSFARGESRVSPWSVLKLLNGVVRAFTRMRNRLYDRGVFMSIDSPVPVIAVGNLCHGGTNKTPMVEMMARRLQDAGLRVGIVSRGYSGETKAPLRVGLDEKSSRRSVTGDEPLMLSMRLPQAEIVVSKDRTEGVKLLASLGVDVILADDAFQHRRMGRDLDIVLIDASCPFGNRYLFPAGTLRETPNALLRADVVIITKVDQVSAESLAQTASEIERFVPAERIFTARVRLESWMSIYCGELKIMGPETMPEGKMLAFSAIGNPDSFHRSLESFGVETADAQTFRDHHQFSWKDVDMLERRARECGAGGFVCTEKDFHNLPENPAFILPLYIPRITVAIDDEERFWRCCTEKLRPSYIVASNGYGEDAIGALLAELLLKRFPLSRVSAFALVGNGKQYRDKSVEVLSPPSDMPSGGVIKYSLRAFFKDMRHGLRKDIGEQFKAWESLRGRVRTPICVGDVYLLMHVLWGQGLTPMLVATAKSVHLSGHWRLERLLLKKRTLRVWTRDEDTAKELQRGGVDAVFEGNPIMDLAVLGENISDEVWSEEWRKKVLLLPGSRPRAYGDIVLLLESVRILSGKADCSFVLVLAPTLDRAKLLSSLPEWSDDGEFLSSGRVKVMVYSGALASAARNADLVIGLGGTANQVCAGLGVPVISIIEKGKLVQKKLLQDAEILVEPLPEQLAGAAFEVLENPSRRDIMSSAGIKRLGGAGALDAVVRYAAGVCGWEAREKLYEVLVRDAGYGETDPIWTEGRIRRIRSMKWLGAVRSGTRRKMS